MVAEGRQCTYRPTIIPNKACSANIYRRLNRRVGRSLKRAHCRRNLVPPGKQAAHNYLELKAGFLALKEFQELCSNKIVLVATDTCALLWRILTWCTRKQVTLSPTHSRPAECGSGQAIQARPDHPNRVVSPSRGLPLNLQQVAPAQIDLFARRFNNKLPLFVSPVPDPLATAVDTLSMPW